MAQVDSSVGGKTAVNHADGKNLIGAFYQPRLVLIDVSVLRTLPRRELCAGLAEVIKYGVIEDAQFFHLLEQEIGALARLDEDLLIETIALPVPSKRGSSKSTSAKTIIVQCSISVTRSVTPWKR